jgi:hypothetical protein
VVESNRASTKESKTEGESRQGEGEFEAMLPHQSIVKVNFCDGDGEIKANGECGGACKETDNHQQAAEEFGEGREIGGPRGKSEAGDELSMVMKSAEDLLISMANHDGAEGKTHDEEREGLQTIEVAQVGPPRETG